MGLIRDKHGNREALERIDNHRRALGESMKDSWTEEAWIQEIPIELRGALTKWYTGNRWEEGIERSSYDVMYDILTKEDPKTWLDH
jgi:hypothetical protein